jgi:hypothetical protein
MGNGFATVFWSRSHLAVADFSNITRKKGRSSLSLIMAEAASISNSATAN